MTDDYDFDEDFDSGSATSAQAAPMVAARSVTMADEPADAPDPDFLSTSISSAETMSYISQLEAENEELRARVRSLAYPKRALKAVQGCALHSPSRYMNYNNRISELEHSLDIERKERRTLEREIKRLEKACLNLSMSHDQYPAVIERLSIEMNNEKEVSRKYREKCQQAEQQVRRLVLKTLELEKRLTVAHAANTNTLTEINNSDSKSREQPQTGHHTVDEEELVHLRRIQRRQQREINDLTAQVLLQQEYLASFQAGRKFLSQIAAGEIVPPAIQIQSPSKPPARSLTHASSTPAHSVSSTLPSIKRKVKSKPATTVTEIPAVKPKTTTVRTASKSLSALPPMRKPQPRAAAVKPVVEQREEKEWGFVTSTSAESATHSSGLVPSKIPTWDHDAPAIQRAMGNAYKSNSNFVKARRPSRIPMRHRHSESGASNLSNASNQPFEAVSHSDRQSSAVSALSAETVSEPSTDASESTKAELAEAIREIEREECAVEALINERRQSLQAEQLTAPSTAAAISVEQPNVKPIEEEKVEEWNEEPITQSPPSVIETIKFSRVAADLVDEGVMVEDEVVESYEDDYAEDFN